MSTRSRGFLALALALLMATSTARAQQASPELVSLLARAALPNQDSVQVATDALPSTWSLRLPLPTGVRFVGALLGRSAATAYVVSGAAPEFARGLARAAAQAVGYTEAPEAARVAFGRLQPQRPLAVERPLCRGGTEVLRIRTHPLMTGTLVTVSYESGPSFECAPPRLPVQLDPWSSLPPLQPPPLPPGASAGPCRPGNSSAGSSGEVVSTLDLPGVLRFYGTQLQAAGWGAAGDSVVVGTWRKVAAGDTAVVTLVVSAPAGARAGCRLLEMQLRQNFPPG